MYVCMYLYIYIYVYVYAYTYKYVFRYPVQSSESMVWYSTRTDRNSQSSSITT